jgi:hypothetical protein
MRVVRLSKHGSARVWLDTLPETKIRGEQIVRLSLDADSRAVDKLRLAALEVYIPMGARIIYGLLGGVLRPRANSGKLNVEIGIASMAGRLFSDAMTESLGTARVGLPKDYAEGVISGLRVGREHLEALSEGDMFVDCAAHGAGGSNSMVFKQLATSSPLLARQCHEGLSAFCCAYGDVLRGYCFEGVQGLTGRLKEHCPHSRGTARSNSRTP